MQFTNINEYRSFLRRGGHVVDLVTIDGEIFTMTHYDAEGSVIEYESDESSIMEVRTHDRYRDGYRDAEVILYA